MLLNIFFKAADGKDYRVTKVLIVGTRKMLDHDALQIGQQGFYRVIQGKFIRDSKRFVHIERRILL